MNKLKWFLCILLLIVVYVPLIISGVRAAPDFPQASQSVVSLGFNLPQTWTTRVGNGLGENATFALWSYPIDFLFGLGSKIGLSFSLLTRLILILPSITIGYYSIKKLLSNLGFSSNEQILGICIYLLNTYFILLIDGGQLSVALAYAIVPLAYISFQEAISGSLKHKFIAALVMSILTFVDLRFFYMLCIILALKFIFEFSLLEKNYLKRFASWILTGIVVSIFCITLNLFWILPLAKVGLSGAPNNLLNSNQVSFLNFTNLYNALMLQQPNWPLNAFGQISPPIWYFSGFLLFVIVAIFSKKLKREHLFFVLLLIVGCFLAKGNNPPFGMIYIFLFNHLPGFILFRDSSKFFLFVALAMSVLIPISVGSKKIIYIGFVIYLALTISPIWRSKMTGMFADQPNQNVYDEISQNIKKDNSFGRILWLPSRPPLGYSSTTHPNLEGLVLAGEHPFDTANVGSYERFNFLRDSNYATDLLEIAGVSYVGYPYPDIRKQKISTEEDQYYKTFSAQLLKKDWVQSSITIPVLNMYKTKIASNLFSTSDRLWWVIGGSRIFDAYKSIPDATLISNPTIFTEETPGIMTRFSDENFGKILLYKRNTTDLLASFFVKNDYTDLNNSLKIVSGNSIWKVNTNDSLSWREFLQNKYKLDNTDFASQAFVSENSSELRLNVPKSDNQILLLRLLVSSKGGLVNIFNGDTLISKINTLQLKPEKVLWGIPGSREGVQEYDDAEFHWFEISLPDVEFVTLKTEGQLNTVSGAIITDKDKLDTIKINTELMDKNGFIIDWEKLNSNQKMQLFGHITNTVLTYEQHSATHYNVNLGNTSGSRLVLFSQTYDKNWQLGKSNALPLYSLTSGFVVHDGGNKSLSYTLQSTISLHILIFEAILFIILILLSLFL